MKKIIALGLFASLGYNAHAVSVTLHSANSGIASINVVESERVIFIEEFWTGIGPGILEFSGLDGGEYIIRKIIHNNSGLDWPSFANELLDPAGDANDANDPQPYAIYIPLGYSTSNESDGLSFAQGSPIPRTSSVWTQTLVDETSDARDFLDFYGGTLFNGQTDNFVRFGLRDSGNNQPFLLVQRPAHLDRDVPDAGAATLALLGLSSILLCTANRKLKLHS